MSFEFHINGNQTTFFILFVLRSCTFGFADYTGHENIPYHSTGHAFAPPPPVRLVARPLFPPLYQQTGIVAQHGLLCPTG